MTMTQAVLFKHPLLLFAFSLLNRRHTRTHHRTRTTAYLIIRRISCQERKLPRNIVYARLEFSRYPDICWQADEWDDFEAWTTVENRAV